MVNFAEHAAANSNDEGHSQKAYDAAVSWLRANSGGAALNAVVEDGYDKRVNWGHLLRKWQEA